jgi:hypothetical protein
LEVLTGSIGSVFHSVLELSKGGSIKGVVITMLVILVFLELSLLILA